MRDKLNVFLINEKKYVPLRVAQKIDGFLTSLGKFTVEVFCGIPMIEVNDKSIIDYDIDSFAKTLLAYKNKNAHIRHKIVLPKKFYDRIEKLQLNTGVVLDLIPFNLLVNENLTRYNLRNNFVIVNIGGNLFAAINVVNQGILGSGVVVTEK